ncbi:DUF433 domain-containing protein [Nostoc flagelliforme FACHB-838]|uniref:DUF433 domain-containing protein n=1 Tax=Nostoc flagelliforme FACHB-838 TaxID=2692904 RepID=A0ABR8DK46_9NOSO|nr:DUF433 domain-containing protein [Nostoc flagelliforme]MBD2529624.1 DUF433 domain-containing protein [Nostoc flagelliforme FACHB-838]
MQKIVSDSKIMMGKPVISETRITVELILEKLAAGETPEQILEAHPRLSYEGIKAALAFAAQALKLIQNWYYYRPNLLGIPSQPPGIVPLVFSPPQVQQ